VATQEDDEFEEFEQQEWTAAEQDAEDTTMWQDGWEDDEEDDQFTKQLRAELAKTAAAAPAPMLS
jgi:26 proteasome complex subunit DSS1